MINLIPPKGRSLAVKEYWIRMLSVWGILVAVAAGITAALLVPTYVLVQSQLSALQKEVVEQRGAGEKFKSAEELVKAANTTAEQLTKPSVRTLSHLIIAEVNEAASDSIRPDIFRIVRNDKVIESVQVQGVADSREGLANFKDTLERSPLFETATVPISDLAQEANLPFAITIKLSSLSTE